MELRKQKKKKDERMDIDNDGLLGTMKLLCWNCHGLGHPYSIRALRRLVKEERPDLVFLSETKKKVCELQSLRSMFGLSSMIKMDCEGEGRQRMSGLLLMCNDNFEVNVKSLSQNHINFMVKVVESDQVFQLSNIYGYSKEYFKRHNMELLKSFKGEDNTPWLCCGNFNVVLNQEEKGGGNVVMMNQMLMFAYTLDTCDLRDLGFLGNRFTWTNKRRGKDGILERVRRSVANPK